MNNISSWKNAIGIDFINKPEDDPLNFALNIGGREFGELDFSDMDDIMIILSNYLNFLKRESGEISARIVFFDNKLESLISPKSAKLVATLAKERRFIIISANLDIAKLNDKLIDEKIKLEIINPVSESIRNKIYVISKIYDRKVKERTNVSRSA